jgi:hypothetical protein
VLQSPNLALAQDDWIVIFSDDSLNAFVDPHMAISGYEYPAELHRVSRIDGSDVILESPVIDTMNSTPKIVKLTMLRNCGLCDLKFRATNVTGGITQYSQFNVSNTLNWRTENLTAEQGGGGYFTLDYSHDVHIANFSGERQQNNNRNYGIVAGTVNGFRFCDSTWHENRHVFTTGTDSVGNNRYGTPRNVVIENVTQHCGGDTDENDYVCFDTHSEGYAVEFRKCRVFASSKQKVIGFNSRSRNTKFIDCEFHGTEDSNTSIAFRDIGTGMVVKGGLVKNAWFGAAKLPGVYGGVFDDFTVDGTHFDNARSACVYQTDGNNVTVKNITTERSGWYNNAGTPFIPRTLIHIEDGSGHKIYNNELNKQSNGASSNDYSISMLNGAPTGQWYDHVDFDGNKCRGYGSGKLGVRGAIGDPNGTSITEAESFQSEYATDHNNRTDA